MSEVSLKRYTHKNTQNQCANQALITGPSCTYSYITLLVMTPVSLPFHNSGF